MSQQIQHLYFFAATSKSFLIFEDQLLPAELAQQLFLFQLENVLPQLRKSNPARGPNRGLSPGNFFCTGKFGSCSAKLS